MRSRLGIIVVIYRGLDAARRGLDALRESREPADRILIVDSASGDGTYEALRHEFSEFDFLALDENRGFSAGVNAGIRKLEEWGGCDAYLLLNPDAELSAEVRAGLLEELESNASMAVVGPGIDGAAPEENPRALSRPRLSTEIRKQWQPLLRNASSERAVDVACSWSEGRGPSFDADWVSGACLLLRRAAWCEVGDFDEGYFLYFEETDWCLRARSFGWRVRFRGDLRIRHEGGASVQCSSKQGGSSSRHFARSRFRFFRKHDGLATALSVSFVHGVRGLARLRRLPMSLIRQGESR